MSDWLTKIIVGVGLIQLKTLPERLWKFGAIGSTSLGTDIDPGFGVTAFTLLFAPTGFLFGYLVTRLFIQGAFARADRQAESDASRGERELRLKQAEVSRGVAQKLAAQSAAGAHDAPGTVGNLRAPGRQVSAGRRAGLGEARAGQE